MRDLAHGMVKMWSQDKFMDKIYLFRDFYNAKTFNGDWDDDVDPFYDAPEDQVRHSPRC